MNAAQAVSSPSTLVQQPIVYPADAGNSNRHSTAEMSAHISVCVCTFRRPQLLERLLYEMRELTTNGLFSYSMVVVDNDINESGREVVARARMGSAISIDYHVEPERSISLARNRSIKHAQGNLIAFIDDDEFPAKDWLCKHLKTLTSCGADGVLGPVIPHFDGKAPSWLINSGLLERRRFNTGEVIKSYSDTRTGNVLLWKRLFDSNGSSFDPKYGKSGGGDSVFFKCMMEKGKIFVWCDEACVFETVPVERQKRLYYLKRACTRGMGEAWVTSFFSLATLRSAVAVVLYSCVLPFMFLLGQHLFMKYLVKICDHVSKLLGYLGIRLVRERPY